MKQMALFQRLAVASVVAMSSTACLVNISEVRDPRPFFEDAARGAASVAGKTGPAEKIHVLVYDPDDHKLVRVSLPLDWIARFADSDLDIAFGDEIDDVCDSDSSACRDARRKLRRIRTRDLKKLPLGPLVEVQDEDGERVFVYLR